MGEEFPTLARTVADAKYTIIAPAMQSTDRYKVGDPIGRGGMGDVLAAKDLLIGREVAIKRLRGTDVPDIMLERFMREACIQGRLDHPAIVPVHELGVDRDGMPYFVMKKLAGTTLARILSKPEPVHSKQRLLRAFVEICLAVEFAHTRGYLHRDIKPDNIVLGEFGEAYIIDWGIAKIVGRDEAQGADTPVDQPSSTRAGLTVGTPGYMSPEQARAARDLDARTDVYALGCVLFEILAGERLHPLGEAGLQSALRGVDARPSRRAPNRDVPPELDALCVQSTAIAREERTPSARALAEAVERFLDGDRDLEMRKRLAREQLELATQAFAAHDVTESRRTAMRHAGRALALDPTLLAAAELVGRLMLEPPRQMPAEVERTIEQDHFDATRRISRVGLYAHAGYVVILAMIAVVGYSSRIYPLAFALMIALNVGVLHWYSRLKTPRSAIIPLIATAMMLALIARMFSPFLVGPAIAAVSATAFMLGVFQATWRGAFVVFAITCGAVLAPWIVEEMGFLTHSYEIVPDHIKFFSPGVVESDPAPVAFFPIYTVVLVAASVFIAVATRRADARIRARLHLQAWQLRQLVPIKTGPED
jgi:serine/threonine-protein kinase